MNDYRVERSSIPGFDTFISQRRDFPLAISFPNRLEVVHFPAGRDESLYASFRKDYSDTPPLAITRWIKEWSDNFIYFNDFLEGKADLLWLAKRVMDDGKGSRYYPYARYEFPDKTGGLFSKPKASYISPALPDAVRVTYWKRSTQRPGQRIFCQRPGDPRHIFWTILLESDSEVTDGEFEQVLRSLRWL